MANMHSDSHITESEKLIRCNVINRDNEKTNRLVKLDHFRLWEYLMTTKHKAQIEDITLCLWVSENEYHQHESVYAHTGEIEPVTRIIISLFVAELGYSNAVTRFVREAETEDVVKILTSHIRDNFDQADDCQIQADKGYGITKYAHVDKRSFILGLEY